MQKSCSQLYTMDLYFIEIKEGVSQELNLNILSSYSWRTWDESVVSVEYAIMSSTHIFGWWIEGDVCFIYRHCYHSILCSIANPFTCNTQWMVNSELIHCTLWNTYTWSTVSWPIFEENLSLAGLYNKNNKKYIFLT